MASWIGLMSNKPLGGAVNMHGVFPVFDLDQVSEAGKDVIIHHLHDRNDRNVIYENAEKGARAAIAAGARGYKGVIHTEVPGNSHHGFTTKVCGEVNAWFLDVFKRSGLL